MSAEVRAVVSSDFEEVHRHLLAKLNPKVPAATWKQLFEYPWRSEDEPLGYGLFDAGSPVGFVSTIWGKFAADGSIHRTCNLSSWITLEPYRSGALQVLMPVLRDRSVTITNLTNVPHVATMFQRLGFGILETHRRILGPPLGALVSAGSRRMRQFIVSPVTPEVGARLDPYERAVFADHRTVSRSVAFWRDSEPPGLVVYTLVRLRGLRSAHIHYASDPAPFSQALAAIRRYFFWKCGVVSTVFDERLLGGTEVSEGQVRKLPVPRLVRTGGQTDSVLSNAYSEMVLLRL